MMAFSEGLDPQGKPPQPLLPGFPVGGGEEDIIESDLTLREEFQSRGAVPASSCWLFSSGRSSNSIWRPSPGPRM